MHASDREPTHVIVARLLSGGILTDLEQHHRAQGDAGQTVVWLVGLGSTLMAVTVVETERLATVLGRNLPTFSTLLLVTVAAGVMCRLLGVWEARRTASMMTGLSGNLLGFATGSSAPSIPKLADGWSEAEIVQELKNQFGLDYQFLLERNVPLKTWREIYIGQCELYERREQESFDVIKSTIAAHLGQTQAEIDRAWKPSGDNQKVRRRAYVTRGLRLMVMAFFGISSVSFMWAVTLLARGLWVLSA